MKQWFYNLKIIIFLKNCYRFRKELMNFYQWNYDLGLFRKTLEYNLIALKNGNEVDWSRNKKIEKIERTIYLLKLFENDDFLDLAQEELGFNYVYDSWYFGNKESERSKISEFDDNRNTLLIHKSVELQNKLWIELWDNIKGQPNTWGDDNEWDKNFDGSGILGWWD